MSAVGLSGYEAEMVERAAQRTCAGMIPDAPVKAADVDVLRMLAAALSEGLPEAVSYRVGVVSVDVHLMGAGDCDQWAAWWTRHGAGEWATHDVANRDVLDPHQINTHRYRRADWRGRTVEVFHIQRSVGEQS